MEYPLIFLPSPFDTRMILAMLPMAKYIKMDGNPTSRGRPPLHRIYGFQNSTAYAREAQWLPAAHVLESGDWKRDLEDFSW